MEIIAYLYSDPLLESAPDPAIWGLEIDRVYQDLGQRQQLKQLLKDCQNAPPDYLLVRQLKELGETVNEIQKNLRILVELNIEIITIEQDINVTLIPEFDTSKIGQIIHEIQVNQQRNNLKKGHARNRLKAVPPPGKAPYGYRRGKDRYLLDRSTAPVVKDFFEQFLLFGSLRGAVRYLEQRYGKKISVSTAKNWLTNPVYRGDLRYKTNEIMPDTHLPIISREESAQIERLLRRNCRLSTKTASAPRSLAGLIVCQTCQSKMTITRVVAKKKNKEYLYIRPMNCPCNPKCKAISYAKILHLIIERICTDLPEVVANLTLPNLAVIKNNLQSEIDHKKNILEQIPTLMQSSILDEETAMLRTYKLRTEIAQLQNQLEQLPPGDLKLITKAVTIPQFWLDLSETERRFYFREFIRTVQIVRQENDKNIWNIKLLFIF